MPAGYHFPGDTDLWQGLSWNLANHSRFAHFMESVARLAPGVSLEQAGAELTALSGRLATEHADSNKDWLAKAVSLQAEVVRRLDRELALSDVRTGEQILASSTAASRFSMVLMGAFAALALLLAAVGIYGVLSYTVAQRRGEIGVRLALGAPPAGVRRLVVAEGMALAGLGAVLGCAAAFCLARFMASLLFGIQVADLPTYGSVALLILAVSLAACYLPARRASAVDPLEALRAE